MDIFGGSNTTGLVAEREKRRWLCFEESLDYLAASSFRFAEKGIPVDRMTNVYERIVSGECVDVPADLAAEGLFTKQ